MNIYITDRNIRVDNADNQISYNSDYIAEFHFDDEWNGKIKTARFVQNGEPFDVVLVNDRCKIPPLKTGFIRVGVFSDSMTSTYADVYFKTSIKDGTGNPAEPPEDVVSQLLNLIERGMLKGDPGYTPQKGIDYWTKEDVENIVNIPARAETERKHNETERKTAESARCEAEDDRVSAEELRNSSEVERKTNETLREDAEISRERTETQREHNETERKTAESARCEAEDDRVSAEEQRKKGFAEYNGRLTNLENELDSLGLSVVDGKLCVTWEE